MSEQVKFYRGNYEELDAHKNPDGGTGEIIMVNGAMNEGSQSNKLGSIYQDEFIVGTTRADQLCTTESITVAGGPLADDVETNWPAGEGWKDDSGNPTIPAGASLQEILSALFLKEKEGNISWGSVTWSPVIKPATVTLKQGDTALSSSSIVEVGTVVTGSISTTANADQNNQYVNNNVRSATATANPTTYGFYDGDTYTSNSTKTVSKNGTSSGTLSTAATWNSVTATVGASMSLVTKEGTNTLSATNSGLSASVDALPQTTVYPATNTKKKVDKAKTLTDSDATATLSSVTSSASCKAYYKYYHGVVTTGAEFTNTTIKALGNSGWLDATSKSFNADPGVTLAKGQTYVVAVPVAYKLTQVQSSLGSPELANFKQESLSYELPNHTEEVPSTASYTVYYIDNNADDRGLKNFIISK